MLNNQMVINIYQPLVWPLWHPSLLASPLALRLSARTPDFHPWLTRPCGVTRRYQECRDHKKVVNIWKKYGNMMEQCGEHMEK